MLWKMDVIGNNKLKYLMKVINIKDRLFNPKIRKQSQ